MDKALKDISVRSATIDELLSSSFSAQPGLKADSLKSSSRLAAWCRASAGGDWHVFAKRLARDGLTFEAVLSRFATCSRTATVSSASWADESGWVYQSLTTEFSEALPAVSAKLRTPVPFTPLLAGLVRAAEERVVPGTDDPRYHLIGDGAMSDLRYSLLQRLSELCSPAFYELLREWRTKTVASQPEPGIPVSESAGLAQFVSYMRAAGLESLFTSKPVLLRLIVSITTQWVNATAEFLRRYQSDHSELRAFVVGHVDDCPLVAVGSGFSDLHNHGRSVLMLEFGDKSRVLYKPKDLRPDAQMASLIAWLNDQDPPVRLCVSRVLVREHYGWAEIFDHHDSPGAESASRYYARAGAWLVLFHVLCATDMHLENMIAAGEYPVPIDFEMLCQPEDLDPEENVPERRALHEARKRIANSVLAVGLLPAFARVTQDSIMDLGGLGGAAQQTSELYWIDVDTVDMKPARRSRRNGPALNVPTCNGVALQLSEYADSLQNGFEAYGRFLIANKEGISSAGIFAALVDVPLRVLVRPTRFYAHLIERLKDVRNMEDGATWSADLDFPSRLADWDQTEELLWPVVQAERKALAELNVPMFFTQGNILQLSDSDGPVLTTTKICGLERAKQRIVSFDADELAWQSELVRMSLSSLAKPKSKGRPSIRCKAHFEQRLHGGSTREAFERCARSAYRTIAENALRSGPGAAWIGVDWLGDSEVSQLVPLGFDLYNGTPGIVLFLAAYSQYTGSSEASGLALAALAPLRSFLNSANASKLARSVGIGGATGLGSIVYALTAAGELLGQEHVVADATRAARLMTSELLSANKNHDVIGGTAGAILGLCKLFRHTGSSDVLHRATECGSHLVRYNLEGVGGIAKSRYSVDAIGVPPLLTGAAHGAAGVALALAVLCREGGDRNFARAAKEYLDAENAIFSPSHMNWPDLREGIARATFPCQWCYGGAGIGLARIAMFSTSCCETAALLADVHHALQCTTEAVSYNDTLCCGDLGNIEFLDAAGKVLDETWACDSARNWLLNLVSEAECRGDYRWTSGNRRFSLGLFRGLAGVGYTALRRLDPAFPNVLVWE